MNSLLSISLSEMLAKQLYVSLPGFKKPAMFVQNEIMK